ncbi:MAG: hypothetical protein H6604_01155 [Flavobacteriales bacterium]|nr:hypothetical protein [Flavobacteriales bacterium]
MEIKKSKNADVTRKSTTFLLMGVNIILLIVIGLFQIRDYKEEEIVEVEEVASIVTSDEPVIVTVREFDPPPPPPTPDAPPPPPIPTEIEEVPDDKVMQKQPELAKTDVEPAAPTPNYSNTGPKKVGPPAPPPPPPPVEKEPEEKIYNRANIDVVALYPGCEKYANDKNKAYSCMGEKLGQDIQNYMSPPENDSGKAYTVACQFVVDEKGNITKIQLNDSAPKEFVNAVKDGISSLANYMEKRSDKGKGITPGKNALGKPVKMNYVIPIRFAPNE